MTLYHGHIYFNVDQHDKIIQFRHALVKALPQLSYIGQPIPRSIGPHPLPMMEIHFSGNDLDLVIGCLDNLRQGLTILLHPVQRNELEAHTTKARWLGGMLDLKLEVLTSN